jgi:hypothetical protein
MMHEPNYVCRKKTKILGAVMAQVGLNYALALHNDELNIF